MIFNICIIIIICIWCIYMYYSIDKRFTDFNKKLFDKEIEMRVNCANRFEDLRDRCDNYLKIAKDYADNKYEDEVVEKINILNGDLVQAQLKIKEIEQEVNKLDKMINEHLKFDED